jgi:PAS domain-containing protein
MPDTIPAADPWRDATSALRVLFDAVPMPLLVVDEDVTVLAFNRAAAPLLGDKPDQMLRRRGGEVLSCLRHHHAPKGCGTHGACKDCVVRASVGTAMRGNAIHRQLTQMDVLTKAGLPSKSYLAVTSSPFVLDGARRVLLVLEPVGDLVQIESLVPICSWCKKVRSGEKRWEPVDAFFTRRLAVDFSHSICDDCMHEHFPDLAAERAREAK